MDINQFIHNLLNLPFPGDEDFKEPEPAAEQTFSPAHNSIEARQQIADRITCRPRDYKVCCGCESVVRERVATCPRCNAYRFEDDPRTVVAHALELANREPTEIFD
jgi:hypothetical protein